jgi:hypothetical protein
MRRLDMKRIRDSALVIALVVLAAFALSSCGGGSGSSGSPATGSVAVLLTDFPSDDYSAVNVTITNIILLSDHGHAEVFSGSMEVNLLDLSNETELVALSESVPSGWYDKVRLVLSNVEILDMAGDPVPNVKLPGHGKLDLNPRRAFFVAPGETLTVRLDMDAEKSLKIDANQNWVVFRPVVFIDVINGVPTQGKLIRATGTARDIDTEAGTFQLCSGDLAKDHYYGYCVQVAVSGETSFFSSFNDGGQVAFADLVEGDMVTVIGKVRIAPLPTGYDEDRDEKMVLDAIVVEVGGFLELSGTIRSTVEPVDADSGQFDFDIDPGQGVSAENPVLVTLQPGTKIYSASGEALDQSAIVIGETAEVDGILLLSDTGPDVLNSAFVSVGATLSSLERLSGQISSINYDLRTFDLQTGTETVCVNVPPQEEVSILEVQSTNDAYTSVYITFGELADGEEADLYGHTDGASGCFVPEVIIASP